MVEHVAVLVGGCHCGALRIRFAATRASHTADVVLCRRCGFILAAVTHAEPVRAVVNVDALEQRATFAEAEPIELGRESLEARLERRAGAWTPATVTVAG